MVGDDDTDILVFEFGYNMLDILHGYRVHSGERFVQQDELRIYGQSPGNLAAAAFAPGKLYPETFADLVQVELVYLRDSSLSFRSAFVKEDISMTDMILSSTDILLNTEASWAR